MKFIGNTIVYLALYPIYAASFGARGGFDLGVFLIACLISTPFLFLGQWIIHAGHGTEQEFRDRRAKEIITNPRPYHLLYFLYLRPFESTNAIRISDCHRNLFNIEVHSDDGFDDIERVLAKTLWDDAAVVALGIPGEHRGAGRHTVAEEEWQATILSLIDHARQIFLLPGSNEGTTWEIEQIKARGLLDKCVLIMPPGSSGSYLVDATMPARWQATVERWRASGINLPPLSEGGALLRHAGNGQFVIVSPLPAANAKSWRKHLDRIVNSYTRPALPST